MKTLLSFLVAVALFIEPLPVVKSVFAELRINEVYPAPSSGEFEWIELYNDGVTTELASQYSLYDETGKIVFINASEVASQNYVLATSSGVLNNSGETIYLRKNGEVVQAVTYAQNITSQQSLALCPDLRIWGAVSTITKLFANLNCSSAPSPTTTPTQNFSPTPQPPQSFSNIYISEVLPNPEIGKEWVELFNGNDFSVTLSEWAIDDELSGGSSPQEIHITIPSSGYKVVELMANMLNNAGDVVYLLDAENNIKDRVEYVDSKKGYSFGRIATDTQNTTLCIQNISFERENYDCIIEEQENLPNEESIQYESSAQEVAPTPTNKQPVLSSKTEPQTISNTFQKIPPKQQSYDHREFIIPPPDIRNEIFSISGALLTASVNNFVYSVYRLYKKFQN